MDAESVFLRNVDLIDRITAFVCRRNRLQPADADDFRSHVHLKLFENDCAILCKFEGRSAISTYLTTVINRLFYHWRAAILGKWRPSAEALRLGEKAVVLERLLTRDGYSLDAAVRELTEGEHPAMTRGELDAIHIRLPPRQPRPVLVSEEMSVAVPAPAATDDDLLRRDRDERAREVAATLDCALQSFPAEDQIILRMRFWQALKVPEIAARLHLEPKKLYKRIDRLVQRLRGVLTEHGIPHEALADLIDHDQDLTLAFARGWEKPKVRDSDLSDGETATGEGRLTK